MGCHTWVYKKVSSLDENYKKDLVNNKIKEISEYWFFTEEKEKIIKEMDKHSFEMSKQYKNYEYKPYTIKEYNRDYNKYKKQQSRLSLEGFDYLVKLEKNSANIKKYKGVYYWNIGFDVPVRVYGYPEKTFTNLEKFLKYLKSLDENDFGYYDNVNFCKGYSDNLEKKVIDYFKEHGENNLFIEFG